MANCTLADVFDQQITKKISPNKALDGNRFYAAIIMSIILLCNLDFLATQG